jgi:hypothetical protein
MQRKEATGHAVQVLLPVLLAWRYRPPWGKDPVRRLLSGMHASHIPEDDRPDIDASRCTEWIAGLAWHVDCSCWYGVDENREGRVTWMARDELVRAAGKPSTAADWPMLAE